MKKIFTIIAIFIQFSVFASSALAYDGSVVAPSGQTIYYNFDNTTSTITITVPGYTHYWEEYPQPTGPLVIPDSITHNGINYPVTSIGHSAFLGSIDLTSVTISNNVTSIGDRAFWNCHGMTSVSIGSGVTTIGFEAFHLCSGLTSVDIPDAVTSMGTYAFSDCYGLTSIHFGSGLTSLPSYAFWECLSLPFVYIPDVITTVGSYAFYGCSSMASVEIGSGVTYIGEGALCCGMQEVRIHTPIPPSLGYPAFVIPTGGANLYVPCGADSAYQSAAQWNRFNIFEAFPYSLSSISGDTLLGIVEVIQVPTCSNPQAVLLATANEGYHFTHWSNGSTDNPLTITLNSDTAITAFFAIDSLSVTVSINDESMGGVIGGGTYAYGDTATLTATANEGYHFEGWSITPGYQNIVTDNPLTINVTEDMAVVAYFAADNSEGIDDIATDNIKVYTLEGSIVVEGADGEMVQIFDMMGRTIRNEALPTGIYLVKVGDHPARKVAVIR